MPDILSRLRLHGEDAARKKLVSPGLNRRQLSVVDACACRSKDDIVRHRVVGDGVPHVGATDPPRVWPRPRFRSHLQSLRFKTLRRLAGDGPEAPDFLSGLGVEGDECPAHAIIGTVVAHEYSVLGHVWRARDARLGSVAHRRLPCLLSRSGVNRDQPAVAGSHENFPLPDCNASVGARGIRAVDR